MYCTFSSYHEEKHRRSIETLTDEFMTFKKFHLYILCITGYLAMAGGALLAPVLPEMVQPLHTTTQAIGLLMSVYTFSTALSTLVISHFIDRIDRKKILVPSLILYGITGIASFFITDFVSLLILRFVQGCGIAGMMTLAFLIIGDVYKGYESMQAISKMSMSLAVGAISAPLIGGMLAHPGWNYPFLFYALSLPFTLVVIASLPETRDQHQTTVHRGIGTALSSLKSVQIFFTVFMGFATFFILYSVIIYVPFMLKDMFGFSSGESGLMLAVEGIAVVLFASQVSTLARRFSVIRVIITGFLLVGGSIVCLSFADSVVSVFLFLVIFGAGYGLAQTGIDAQIIHVTPPHEKGGILSLHTCMKYVGMSLSPIVLGIVLSVSNLHIVFILSGLFGIMIALLALGMRGRFDVPVIHPVTDTSIQARTE